MEVINSVRTLKTCTQNRMAKGTTDVKKVIGFLNKTMKKNIRLDSGIAYQTDIGHGNQTAGA